MESESISSDVDFPGEIMLAIFEFDIDVGRDVLLLRSQISVEQSPRTLSRPAAIWWV
jgi:hypothetical protein